MWPLIVSVDDIERWPPPVAEDVAELAPVGCGVDVEERDAVRARIVGRPSEREHALFVFDGRCDDGAVVGMAYVDDDVIAAADTDGLADMLDGLPGGESLIFVVVVDLLDVDVLVSP